MELVQKCGRNTDIDTERGLYVDVNQPGYSCLLSWISRIYSSYVMYVLGYFICGFPRGLRTTVKPLRSLMTINKMRFRKSVRFAYKSLTNTARKLLKEYPITKTRITRNEESEDTSRGGGRRGRTWARMVSIMSEQERTKQRVKSCAIGTCNYSTRTLFCVILKNWDNMCTHKANKVANH